MRYLKIINGEQRFAFPEMTKLECPEHNKTIFNPKEEDILECGYKPIRETECPTFDFEVEFSEERLTETEDYFLQEWVLVQRSEFESVD